MNATSNQVARCGRVLDANDAIDSIISRRNHLIGIWAARKLGLSPKDYLGYALSVNQADQRAPGYDDLVDKIATDFTRHGLATPREELCRALQHMENRAAVQLAAERALQSSGIRTRAQHYGLS